MKEGIGPTLLMTSFSILLVDGNLKDSLNKEKLYTSEDQVLFYLHLMSLLESRNSASRTIRSIKMFQIESRLIQERKFLKAQDFDSYRGQISYGKSGSEGFIV